MTQPRPSTSRKSDRTRARIREAAFSLFASRGYHETTMRDIAAEADCSLGLTYRYFKNKDDLVMSLYLELAEAFIEEIDDIPAGSIAERFRYATRKKLQILGPHRRTLGAVLASALQLDSPIAVLGDATRDIRERMHAAFTRLVAGSDDVPAGADPADLALLLYGVHLSVLLFWYNDRSENVQATKDLIDVAAQMLLAYPALAPLAGPNLAPDRLASIFRSVFLAAEAPASE